MLLDIFSEYGLKHQQLVSTITDNGSNFIKAFAEFGVTQGIYIVILIFIANVLWTVKIVNINLDLVNLSIIKKFLSILFTTCLKF